MKQILFLIILLISISIYSQEYSRSKIENLVDKLFEISTDSPSFYEDETYLVVDNWTDITIYKNKNYVDNKIHKIFLKIVRKAKINDLLIMSKSDYPNIRVYAFWAILKRGEKELASEILIKESNKKQEKVWFDSFGDLILDYITTDLMNELLRMENHIQNN